MITEGNPEEGTPILRKGNPKRTRVSSKHRIPLNDELKRMGYTEEEVELISLYHRNLYRLPFFLPVNQFSEEVRNACFLDASMLERCIEGAATDHDQYTTRTFVRLVWSNY